MLRQEAECVGGRVTFAQSSFASAVEGCEDARRPTRESLQGERPAEGSRATTSMEQQQLELLHAGRARQQRLDRRCCPRFSLPPPPLLPQTLQPRHRHAADEKPWTFIHVVHAAVEHAGCGITMMIAAHCARGGLSPTLLLVLLKSVPHLMRRRVGFM